MASKPGDQESRAQELFYASLEAATDKQQLALLEQALKLDPGNVDALLTLVSHTDPLPEKVECLRQLLRLAQQRLGREAFREFAGAFWGFHETRPYMRVRATLAEALCEAGRDEEAIVEWQGMLELNPGDNQGVRYALLGALLALGRVDEARKLLEKYPEEPECNPAFAWGRVLERFLANDLAGVTAALAVARRQNPHMQAYVKGRRKLPRQLPYSYSLGSLEEAMCFAEGTRKAWLKHPAALAWLESQK